MQHHVIKSILFSAQRRFLATGTMTCATRPIVTSPVRSQPQGVLGLSEKRIHLPMKPKAWTCFKCSRSFYVHFPQPSDGTEEKSFLVCMRANC